MTERAKKYLELIQDNQELRGKLEKLAKAAENATDEEYAQSIISFYHATQKEFNLEKLTEEDAKCLINAFSKDESDDELDNVAGGNLILPFPPRFNKEPYPTYTTSC